MSTPSLAEGRMFERSFGRPKDYFKLNADRQWRIDDNLDILDWFGGCSHQTNLKNCAECSDRFNKHYGLSKEQ